MSLQDAVSVAVLRVKVSLQRARAYSEGGLALIHELPRIGILGNPYTAMRKVMR